ncbi:hypothetical protein EI94DRAFT_557008 [Lactarius quietus]|nr:hypothetical protein EI94DRAFT_557008 [Lactarius quietus]
MRPLSFLRFEKILGERLTPACFRNLRFTILTHCLTQARRFWVMRQNLLLYLDVCSSRTAAKMCHAIAAYPAGPVHLQAPITVPHFLRPAPLQVPELHHLIFWLRSTQESTWLRRRSDPQSSTQTKNLIRARTPLTPTHLCTEAAASPPSYHLHRTSCHPFNRTTVDRLCTFNCLLALYHVRCRLTRRNEKPGCMIGRVPRSGMIPILPNLNRGKCFHQVRSLIHSPITYLSPCHLFSIYRDNRCFFCSSDSRHDIANFGRPHSFFRTPGTQSSATPGTTSRGCCSASWIALRLYAGNDSD